MNGDDGVGRGDEGAECVGVASNTLPSATEGVRDAPLTVASYSSARTGGGEAARGEGMLGEAMVDEGPLPSEREGVGDAPLTEAW